MIVGVCAVWAAGYLAATFLPRSERRVLAVGVALGTGALIGLAAFVDGALRVLSNIT